MKMVVDFDGFNVSGAKIYKAASRLANLYEPNVEVVLQPDFQVPGEKISFEISDGISSSNYKNKLRKYIARKYVRADVEEFGGVIYDARSFYNRNIAHLTQYHLNSLAVAEKNFGVRKSDVSVIVSARESDMVTDFFRYHGYVCVGSDADVKGCIFRSGVNDDNFFPVMKILRENLDDDSVVGKRLAILRRGSRCITNEGEIVKYLEMRGFSVYWFESGVSIDLQMKLFSEATDIVAVHGAALGYLPFVKYSPLRLIEIFPSGFVVNPFRKMHASLFPLGGWAGVVGKIDWRVARDIDDISNIKKYAYDNFEVDVNSLEQALIGVGSI